MNRFICLLAALLVLCLISAPLHAQTPKDELKVRFKGREADLGSLRQQGRVGETIDGFVDVVDVKAPLDEHVSKLVGEENTDRRLLYQVLADEINKEHPENKLKATIETVAVRNARRNFERAGPTEFLRVAKDHWVRAKDFPRFEKLTTLKTQGKVGETSTGLLEFVQAADRSDATAARLLEEENTARTAEYRALADKERVEVSAIEMRMANRNFENARVGDMVKDDRGSWRRK